MIRLDNRIGVHILTRNRPEYLGILLSSLLRQTKKEWDLIVIDNSDVQVERNKYIKDLVERMRYEGHRVVVHHNENMKMRTNIGASRNLAIEKDDLEIGCRIDDDSWLEPDYLERLYNVIISDENIGAVGGIVPYTASAYTKRLPKIFNRIFKEGNDWLFSDDGHFRFDETEIIESHHLRSSFMYRKEAMKKAGMHPLEYGSTGFREETDLSIRLLQAGYKLMTDPQAICWHMIATGKHREDNNYDIQREKVNANEQAFKQKIYPICEELKERKII